MNRGYDLDTNTDPKPRAMTEFELALVRHVVSTQPAKNVYLEIGAAEGGSLLFFGKLMDPGALLLSVDKARNPRLDKAAADLTASAYEVRLITGDSRSPKLLAQTKQMLGGRPVDVLFIDGDHSYFGCASDAHNYAPLVRSEGLIIFHDCGAFAPRLGERGNRNVGNVRPIFDALAYGKKTIRVQEFAGIGIIFV